MNNEQQEKRDRKFKESIQDLIVENFAIPNGSFCNIPESRVQLLLTDNKKPMYVRQYLIARSLQPILDDQIKQWKENKIIELAPVNCTWNSPLIVVKQLTHDGNIKHRVCIDPRHINKRIMDDKHPLTPVWEQLLQFHDIAHISIIDLQKGFNQFEIAPESREITTFTHNGQHYVFRGAPFGLKTLPAIFQRVMRKILGDLPFVTNYMDDVFIITHKGGNHHDHVSAVIKRLTLANLRINSDKSKFDQTCVRILGHIITPDGIATDPEKVNCILAWPRPQTGQHIMSFLGLVNYLGHLIPKLAQVSTPLNRLRQVSQIAESDWTQDCEDSFQALKNILKERPFLSHPDYTQDFFVATEEYSINGTMASPVTLTSLLNHYLQQRATTLLLRKNSTLLSSH